MHVVVRAVGRKSRVDIRDLSWAARIRAANALWAHATTHAVLTRLRVLNRSIPLATETSIHRRLRDWRIRAFSLEERWIRAVGCVGVALRVCLLDIVSPAWRRSSG